MSWTKISAGESVPHDYEIMVNPVVNAEYCTWLNSLDNDTAASRYCKLMAEHFFGGILEKNGEYCVKPGFEKKPVVFVSWYDAKAYAKWVGGRLPTAEEWRHAAAWMPGEERLATWCTGSDETPTQDQVNFYDFENGWALPAPHIADVDWYKPNGAFGLCGMAGNVAEWVDSETRNGWKLALGGSLFRPVDFLRTDAGEADHPSKRLSTFGFRLARD